MNWCMALVELAQSKHSGIPTDLLILSGDGKKLICRDRREVLNALNTVASKRAHPSATRGANGTSRTDIIWPNLLRALYNRGVCFVPASRHSVEGAFIRKNNDAFVPPGKSWDDVDLEAIFKSDRKKRRKKRERGSGAGGDDDDDDDDDDDAGEPSKRQATHRPSMSASAAAQALVSAAHSAQSAHGRMGNSALSSSALSTALAARIKLVNAHAAAQAASATAAQQQQQQSALAATLGALQGLSREALTQLVVQLQVRHRDAEMREMQLREAVVQLQQENAQLRQQMVAMRQTNGGPVSSGLSVGRPRANSTLSTASSAAGAVASGGRIRSAGGPIPPGPPTAGGAATPHGTLMPGLISPAAAAAMNDSMLARGHRSAMTSHEAALMLMGGATPGSHADGDAGGELAAPPHRGRRGSYDMDELAADAKAARAAVKASEAAALSASDATGIRLHAPRLDGPGSVGPPTIGNGDGHSTIGYTPRDRRRPSLLPADDDMSEAADALQALSGGLTPAHAEDGARTSLAAAAAQMSMRRGRSNSTVMGRGRGRIRSRSEADRLM